MKKLLFILLLGIFPLIAKAQIPVVDGLSNKELLNQIAKWVQDYAKQHGQKINLDRILGENKTTQEKITALLELKQEIEKYMYSPNEFKKLRISDLSKVLEEIYGLGSASEYGKDLPFMEEYSSYLDKPASVDNAQELYNYLFAGTGAYMPDQSGTFEGYLKVAKEQKAKAYAIHIAAQKRKMAASMTYKRLSEQYTQMAEDLSAQINAEGEHRMTTGERIKAQKTANDYLVKSLEMKQKADQLMREATQKTPLVQEIDQARQNYLNRKALAETELY